MLFFFTLYLQEPLSLKTTCVHWRLDSDNKFVNLATIKALQPERARQWVLWQLVGISPSLGELKAGLRSNYRGPRPIRQRKSLRLTLGIDTSLFVQWLLAHCLSYEATQGKYKLRQESALYPSPGNRLSKSGLFLSWYVLPGYCDLYCFRL